MMGSERSHASKRSPTVDGMVDGGRPSGYVLVVGPDGSGKTMVIDRLHAIADAAGVAVVRAFWRPKLVPGGLTYGYRAKQAPATSTRPPIGATVRLLLTLLDYAVAGAVPWRTARRSGLLFVQRGWYDMVVDPGRYGLSSRLAAIANEMGRLVVRADLVLVLHGDPHAIRARKPELSPEQIEGQIDAWRRLAPRAARRVLELDTVSGSPDRIARVAWDALPRGARRAA